VEILIGGSLAQGGTGKPPANKSGAEQAETPRNIPGRFCLRYVMKKVFLASCLALSFQAAAQGFLGGGIGQSDIDESIVRGLIDSGAADGKDTGWKIFGGYMVSPYFGLELAYVDLGDVAYSGAFRGFAVSDGRLRLSGLNIAGLLSYPATRQFSVFGKLGLFLGEAKFGDTIGGVPSSGSDETTDVSFGLGAAFDFTRNLGMRAEWEQFRFEDGDSADLFSVSVVLRF
jgi:OOP family OmpA-OmpF porin